MAKFRLKLKKVRKTTRPFRYDLNKIPYSYTVEVIHRVKGLDLADRVPEEVGMEVCNIAQEALTKIIPKKRKYKKAKGLSEEALQIVKEIRKLRGKGERDRYIQLNAGFQRIARRDKKAFFNEQCKEIEKNNRMGKTREFLKKIRDNKGMFHTKMCIIKYKNGMSLTEAEDIKKRWQEYRRRIIQKRSS